MAGGNIYQRISGKNWTIDFTLNGQRVREVVGPNKRLAEMVLKKRITEVLENRYFNKRNPGSMSFSEFAKLYLERVTAGQKSARTERNRVKYWIGHFAKRPLGQITRTEILDWQRSKQQAAAPATVNRVLCRLRHMLNRAVEWDHLDKSPMVGLKFLRENNARQRYLSLEECSRLIEGCIAPHLQAIVILALHTGMRQGEILKLQYGDLDFATGFILVRDSKNGEPRHIPMDRTVAMLLKAWNPLGRSEFLFPSYLGGHLTEIRKGFQCACERAGLSNLHFHDLRHTFASQWMMNGGDLYALKDILGHKSILMTQRYAHLSPKYKRAVIERMDNIWGMGEGAAPAAPEPEKAPSPVALPSQAHPTALAGAPEPASGAA